MPDPETVALLRAVLDELCASVSPFDLATRTNVASRPLETVKHGSSSLDDLKRAGIEALRPPPTMWRWRRSPLWHDAGASRRPRVHG